MAKLKPLAVWSLLKEVRTATQDERALVVSGMLAEQLAKELARGAEPGAVQVGGPVEEAAALVRVLAGAPTTDDEDALRAANRAGVPIVAVQTGSGTYDVPYVLATDVIAVPPGSGFPVEEIARTLATRLGDRGLSLVARLPVLRAPMCEALIERFSRKNGLVGVAVFVPGADLPVLTLNQVRLVLRIAAAHGVELDQHRLPEVFGTVAAGFAFRSVARQALCVLPVAGWLVKGAVAYTGTRAIGEAAVRYFAVGIPAE
jgi:uncharacterized protein (DUF697 family)